MVERVLKLCRGRSKGYNHYGLPVLDIGVSDTRIQIAGAHVLIGIHQIQPPASNPPKVGDDTVGHLSGKRHTGVHPPGAFVVAAGALVDAAGDKQGAAGAGAVDDVDGVVLMIIHSVNLMPSPRPSPTGRGRKPEPGSTICSIGSLSLEGEG